MAPETTQPETEQPEQTLRFGERLGYEMVDLYVGPDETHIRVHKKVICDAVPYFHAMFDGGYRETVEQKATFPEDDSNAFHALLNWIYSMNIDASFFNTVFTPFEEWVRVYALADKFNIIEVKDLLMLGARMFNKDQGRVWDVFQIEQVWELCRDGCKARDYAVYCLMQLLLCVAPSNIKESTNEQLVMLLTTYPDLLTAVLELIRGPSMKGLAQQYATGKDVRPNCDFHEHTQWPCLWDDIPSYRWS